MKAALDLAESNKTIWDVIIVGAGPAGLASAIYARRNLSSTLVLEQETHGGQMMLTNQIDNYPGAYKAAGYELADNMRNQAEDLGAVFKSAQVTAISKSQDGLFEVAYGADLLLARTLIYAAGASAKQAGFDGEKEFLGKGVSYCATCDGMFYKNKLVFVIGGGNSASEEALYLSKIAMQVQLVVRKDELRASKSLVDALESNPKVEIMRQHVLKNVSGENFIDGVELINLANGHNVQFKSQEEPMGIFVSVGRTPNTQLISNLVELDSQGYAVTDEELRTSAPGLFVAGDCRRKSLRQIVTAVSDGAIAATSAIKYLSEI